MSNSSPHPEGRNSDNPDAVSRSLKEESRLDNQSSGKDHSQPPLTGGMDENPTSPEAPKKPSIFKRAWTKLGINGFVVTFMVKPALAVTIGAGIYQRHSVASNYLNFGYLIMIVSLLTVPMLPRGKFVLNLILTVFLTCFGAAMVLFGQWLSVKARQNTTSPDAPIAIAHGYNSSAAAVNAIFLIVNVWGINVLRAARPIFSIPSVVYTVFVVVGFVYGPQEYSEFRSKSFVREIFYAFLTGNGITAGVSLIILPVSSRKVFFLEASGFLQSCRGLLKAEVAFVETLEHSGLCEPKHTSNPATSEDRLSNGKPPSETTAAHGRLMYANRAAALKGAAAGVMGLGNKIREDVVFAKREVAYGHLRGSDIGEIHLLIRNIMIPISGLSTLADIAERLIIPRGEEPTASPSAPHRRAQMFSDNEQAEWHELIKALNPSLSQIIRVLDDSLLHVLVLFKLVPPPPQKASSQNGQANTDEDVEKGVPAPQPGDLSFGDFLDQQIKDFRQQRTAKLQLWAEERGLSAVFHTSAEYWSSKHKEDVDDALRNARELRVSQRLHIILYLEYLLYSVSRAILAMVRFSESKMEDGTMAKQRFIFPSMNTLRRLVHGLVNGEDSSPDIEKLDNMAGNVETVYFGDSLGAPKDPEHLPAKSFRQVWGNHIRKIPKFLGSDPVKFGTRVTVAVMSVGIMAYLKNSRSFFIRQRVVWALVMIAIGMSPSSGSAVFSLLGNCTATLGGMIGAFINWYIVDQKTPGVIVFLFFFMMFYFYFAAKNPRFLVAIVAGAVTHILTIGNELQVRVLGLKQYTATGQPYYPLYELAPYRLLVVGGGCLVAYIWTVFPVPITEGSVLRKDLGGSLFLLANYVSAVTATVDQRLMRKEGDMSLRSSPGRKLEKLRLKVLGKQLALLNSMRQNLAFMAWEPTLGGDFPKKTYKAIIDEVQNVVNYLTIIAFASEAFTAARLDPSTSTWLTEFSASRIDHKSHKITSLLALLSASVRNAQPLPPYTKAPSPYPPLAGIPVGGDTHILGLNNLDQPGFRAIAVIEVAHECLTDSMDVIVGLVRDLVGEVDFSYQIIHSSTTSSSSMI